MTTITSRRALALAAVVLPLLGCAKLDDKDSFQAGDLQVRLQLEPDPPIAGDNKLRVELRDQAQRPVDGARISLGAVMPAMGAMPEMKGSGESRALGGGAYEVSYPLPMAGDWSVTLGLDAPGHAAAQLRLKVAPPRKGYSVEGSAMPAKENAGVKTLDVSPERQQLIGVVYGAVEKRPLALSLRATGRVDTDETQLSEVVLRYDAFVEEVHAAQLGQQVKAGQPLLTIYSPELFASEQDLVVAKKSADGNVPGAEQLLRVARERLRLWSLSPAQIAAIEQSGKPEARIVLRAPASGTVLEKNVVAGSRAMVGAVLFRIGNLGRVWVLADLFESDAPYLRVGQPASMTVPWAPATALRGRVEFVYPTVDERTRALRVRLSFPSSRSASLKPGMFVDVRVEAPLGVRLSVPDSALLVSGEHRYAFVQRGEGRLLPVEVKVGALAGDFVEVLGGLTEGDKVATQATFLLSSEAQLRDAIPRWSTP